MYIKLIIPQYKIKRLFLGIKRIIKKEDEVHYIGGAEILPPPLNAAEEAKCLSELAGERSDEAKKTLIEHNLRLVVYIAKKFDNTGVGVCGRIFTLSKSTNRN